MVLPLYKLQMHLKCKKTNINPVSVANAPRHSVKSGALLVCLCLLIYKHFSRGKMQYGMISTIWQNDTESPHEKDPQIIAYIIHFQKRKISGSQSKLFYPWSIRYNYQKNPRKMPKRIKIFSSK